MSTLKVMHIKLDAELRHWVAIMAASKHITKSDVIREGISALAEREGLVSSVKTPEQTMNELRSLVGRYFEGVDAEAYVSSLRGETDERRVSGE